MKKAKFSLVLSGVLFLLLVGVQSVNAQSVSMDEGSVLSPKDVQIDDVNLVQNTEAISVLTDAFKTLDMGNTPADEAQASARGSYYLHLVEELEGGANLSTLLPGSTYDLYMIAVRFDESMGIDQQTIYDETVLLLTN